MVVLRGCKSRKSRGPWGLFSHARHSFAGTGLGWLSGVYGDKGNGPAPTGFPRTTEKLVILSEARNLAVHFKPQLFPENSIGVSIQMGILVTEIQGDRITVRKHDRVEHIRAGTVLWCGGTKGANMGQVLTSRTGVELDRVERVMAEPDLSLPDYPDIFVVGDLAHFAHQDGEPLPSLAPVAMQQGRYVANAIKKRLTGQSMPSFRYWDRGNLAVIGRDTAMARLGWLKFGRFLAWLAWVLVHITYLIEFDNKLLMPIQRAWNYVTHKRGTRLIIGKDPFPLVRTQSHQRSQDSA